MKAIVAVLILSVVLCGCASAVSERVANNYTAVGAAAERRGDWDTARRAFARATLNADQAGLPPSSRAIAHYEYGRSLGVTCFFDESERELNAAYELDKQAGQPLFFVIDRTGSVESGPEEVFAIRRILRTRNAVLGRSECRGQSTCCVFRYSERVRTRPRWSRTLRGSQTADRPRDGASRRRAQQALDYRSDAVRQILQQILTAGTSAPLRTLANVRFGK